MDNCIFCKIVAKQIPATVLYEDDDLMAFNDINPAAPVHFLIIPKKHLSSLADAKAEDAVLLGKMLELVPKLAAQQDCAYIEHADGSKSGGFKTVVNTGPNGGQIVYHLHMHVIGGAKL